MVLTILTFTLSTIFSFTEKSFTRIKSRDGEKFLETKKFRKISSINHLCLVNAITTFLISLTSTSDSNFKSRLQDSTENWDSHNKKRGPNRMFRPKSLMREGQSLSTNPFHRTPACKKESRGTYQE